MKNPFKFVLITICGFLLLVACNNSDIIPKKDMVKILKKIYLTDGVINVPENLIFSAKDTIQYYEPILEHYGYTIAQFDSSISYYSDDPEVFDEIFDRVIIELSKLEEKAIEIQTVKDSLIADSIRTVDSSLNLWPHKTYWDMALDHHTNPSLGFDIPVKEFGNYVFTYDVQIFPDDESEDTRMYIFFYYDDKTVNGNRSKDIIYTFPKDGEKRTLRYVLELDDPKVTHISGWLYDHGGERAELKRHALFSNFTVNYIGKAFSDTIKIGRKRIVPLKRNLKFRESISVEK